MYRINFVVIYFQISIFELLITANNSNSTQNTEL